MIGAIIKLSEFISLSGETYITCPSCHYYFKINEGLKENKRKHE